MSEPEFAMASQPPASPTPPLEVPPPLGPNDDPARGPEAPPVNPPIPAAPEPTATLAL